MLQVDTLRHSSPYLFINPDCKGSIPNEAKAADAVAFLKTRQPHILLVEDTDYIQLINTLFLQQMGCQVTLADNGRIAFRKARKYNYDLILMDIGLPIMSGIEAAKAIRLYESNLRRYTPIIALTAYGDLIEKECRLAGIDGIATKPLLFENLAIILAEHLNPKI